MNAFTLVGLLPLVALALVVEHLIFRRRRRAADAVIAAGLQAAYALPPVARQPATWQGDGLSRAVPSGATEGDLKMRASSRLSKSCSASPRVVGRISARRLVALTCRDCGADLLPDLDHTLRVGCACQQQALRRIS